VRKAYAATRVLDGIDLELAGPGGWHAVTGPCRAPAKTTLPAPARRARAGPDGGDDHHRRRGAGRRSDPHPAALRSGGAKIGLCRPAGPASFRIFSALENVEPRPLTARPLRRAAGFGGARSGSRSVGRMSGAPPTQRGRAPLAGRTGPAVAIAAGPIVSKPAAPASGRRGPRRASDGAKCGLGPPSCSNRLARVDQCRKSPAPRTTRLVIEPGREPNITFVAPSIGGRRLPRGQTELLAVLVADPRFASIDHLLAPGGGLPSR